MVGDGTHAFRLILNKLDPVILTAPEQLRDDPEHSLLIVLGDTRLLERVDQLGHRFRGGWLQQFVRNGGAVLVATDRPLPRSPWGRGPLQDAFGVSVGRQFVRTRADSPSAFRQQFGDCPVVKPWDPTRWNPPLFKNLNRVTTNRPSYLELWGDEVQLRLLALFPDDCRLSSSSPLDFALVLPFAMGGELGDGRVLILADHSVFINDMMLQPDTDNIRFADNCITWLTGPGQRNRILFADDGIIRPNFNVPLNDPELPTEEQIAAFLNQLIKDEQGTTNRWFPPWLVPALLTGALLVYGFVRLTGARHRIEPGTPLFAAALSRLAPSGLVVEQRHQVLLSSGNLGEPARSLARQLFESATGRPTDNAVLPTIHVAGSWLKRRRLEQLVRRLWQLAYGPPAERVSPQEFVQLLAQMDEVNLALHAGTLRLETGRQPFSRRGIDN
jgi:hypothetical protein